jgi:hypothetical protein
VYTTIEDEQKRIAELEQIKLDVEKLRAQIDSTIKHLKYAREKLYEAQERNRKLDWLLTKAEEGR